MIRGVFGVRCTSYADPQGSFNLQGPGELRISLAWRAKSDATTAVRELSCKYSCKLVKVGRHVGAVLSLSN